MTREPMIDLSRLSGMRRRAAVLAAALLSLAGCASTVRTGEPTEQAYTGPLHLAPDEAKHPGAGAAGDVVECDHWGSGGFSDTDVYSEGATARSAEQALEYGRSERIFGGVQKGLVLAKEEDDRVLYVLEVDGQIKQAVIVRDGPATDGAGGSGWYVESWAHCDYSELPRSFTDSIGLQVWTDSRGRPVPTSAIESYTGPEHCDWESMTFLTLGKHTYVRDPQPGLGRYFVVPYDPHSVLPRSAIVTGFEREGDHLWLSRDRRMAFVGDANDVEVWPRTVKPLYCS